MSSAQRRQFRLVPRLILAFAALALTAACVGSPTSDAVAAEAINEIGNELLALRDDNALLQMQVDSLKSVAARQDTLLRQIANTTGIPVP